MECKELVTFKFDFPVYVCVSVRILMLYTL